MLVECYDPKADQWNILQTPILEGRSGPGCAVLDDSIVLVGGYSWSMVPSHTFTHTHTYGHFESNQEEKDLHTKVFSTFFPTC